MVFYSHAQHNLLSFLICKQPLVVGDEMYKKAFDENSKNGLLESQKMYSILYKLRIMVTKEDFKAEIDKYSKRDDWTGDISYRQFVEIIKILLEVYLEEQNNIQNEKINEL